MQRAGKRESFVLQRPTSQGSASPSTVRALSTSNYPSSSTTSLVARPRNSVKNEIVALLFDTMIKTIVKSWKTLEIKDHDAKHAATRTSSDTEEKKKTTRTSYNSICLKYEACIPPLLGSGLASGTWLNSTRGVQRLRASLSAEARATASQAELGYLV